MGYQGSTDLYQSNLAPLVDKMLGNAYLNVLCVANNIDAVTYLASVMQGGSLGVGANLNPISAVGITAASILVCPARIGAPGIGRRTAIIKNTNPQELYLTTSPGVTTGGFPIDAGDTLILENTANIYLYYPSGGGTASILENY